MAYRYVDPAAGGANNGTSWTDAWTNIQSAFDTAVSADVVLCRGTQTLSADIDIDTNSGAVNTGYIFFLGCNASGVRDGTLFTITGDGSYRPIFAGVNFLYFENFKFTNCTDGIYAASNTDGHVFMNCEFINNVGHGINNTNRIGGSVFVRCKISSNGANGVYYSDAINKYILCEFINNTSEGILRGTGSDYCTLYGCVIHGNGGSYDISLDTMPVLIGCVIDQGAPIGYQQYQNTGYAGLFIGNRFTNYNAGASDVGLDHNSLISLVGWCYFYDNDSDEANATYRANIVVDGANTNEADDSDGDGYNDRSSDDFNLTSSAAMRRAQVEVP